METKRRITWYSDNARTRLAAESARAVLLSLALPLAAEGQITSLEGRVLDSTTGAPVVTAEIRLRAVAQAAEFKAVTRADGTFTFIALAPGRYIARVDRIGYLAREDTVVVGTLATAPLVLNVSPLPIPVSGVHAQGSARAPLNALGGFWQRRERNIGHFMTRQDIERLRPHRTADLFRPIPGARIQAIGHGQIAVFGRVVGGRPCVPAMFVDGVPYVMTDRGLDDFSPASIEAVEVYSGSARNPPEFNATGRDQPMWRNDQIVGSARCGVIVLWTRRGEN